MGSKVDTLSAAAVEYELDQLDGADDYAHPSIICKLVFSVLTLLGGNIEHRGKPDQPCEEIEQCSTDKKPHKDSQVSLAHTVIQQCAVMVESFHTVVA